MRIIVIIAVLVINYKMKNAYMYIVMGLMASNVMETVNAFKISLNLSVIVYLTIIQILIVKIVLLVIKCLKMVVHVNP